MSGLVERGKTHEALAVASRVRLLDLLRASARPLDARELAVSCGLHISTVRFHLQLLAEAGLVHSESDSSKTRGRPRLLYTPASAGGTTEHRGYQLLATVLAAHWADTPAQRTHRAERAGRATATEHRLTPAPSVPMTTEEAVVQISGLFTELGFEPELARQGDDLQIRLHACPFQAVAQQHPEVVCSVHLGLLRGALAELKAPAMVSSLRPFVEPHLCIAHITPLTEPSPDARDQGPQTPSAGNRP